MKETDEERLINLAEELGFQIGGVFNPVKLNMLCHHGVGKGWRDAQANRDLRINTFAIYQGHFSILANNLAYYSMGSLIPKYVIVNNKIDKISTLTDQKYYNSHEEAFEAVKDTIGILSLNDLLDFFKESKVKLNKKQQGVLSKMVTSKLMKL